MVELLRQVAGELEVLLLVVADRDERGVVEEDVRRHQHGVEQQAGIDRLLLAGLVLELGHPLQLAERTEAAEDPSQLRVADDMGLREKTAPGRVEAAGHVLGQAGVGVLPQLGRHVGDRDGVLVDDAEVAIVVVLHASPVEHRSKIITQVETPGRLGTGQDHGLGGLSSLVSLIPVLPAWQGGRPASSGLDAR
jgi:hypothetical protein